MRPDSVAEVFAFGQYRLDTGQGVLLRRGEPVPLFPKAVQLLAELVRNAGRVVRREQLVEALWPDVVVEEGNLAKLVFLLRKELGEDLIQTVPKRGYRFSGQLTPPSPVLDASPAVVAVLPFVDLSEGRTEGSFCEGVSEEILNAVSRVPGTKVVARSSSFKFGGDAPVAQEIGRRLSASLLVEGSIRKSGGRLRVTARLVDAGTGYQRWSHVFDRPAEDVFAVQDEIARTVARCIHPELPEPDLRAPRALDLETYELFLKGRYHWNRRPGPVVWEALKCFEKVIERAPRYAEAWAAIADIYATLGSWESGVLEPAEAESKARTAAARALEIDPDLGEAHTSLAYVAMHQGLDLRAGEEGFRHGLRLNPNYAPAHHWYSHCLAAAGSFAESLAQSRFALALDPMNLLLSVHLAWHHHMAREPSLTLEQAERVVEMDRSYHWGHYFVGWGAEALGETGRAVEAMREAVRSSGEDSVMVAGLARAHAAAGDRREAQAALRELERRRKGRALFAYEEAIVHLALGDRGRALGLLAQAKADRSGWMAYLAVDPRLDPLRGDPRFQALLPAG